MTDPDNNHDDRGIDGDPLADNPLDDTNDEDGTADEPDADNSDDDGGGGDDGKQGLAEGAGNTLLAGGVMGVSTLLGTRLFPKSEKLWIGVAKLGLKKVKKTTGADMIGFLSNAGGQLEPTPMKLKERDEDGSKYWATIQNDVEYDIGPQGVSREYLGDVPVGFFVEDPPREVSLLEARTRDAVDLGQHQPLVDGEVILHEHVYQDAAAVDTSDEGRGAAVADGGHAQAPAGAEQVFDREMEINAEQVPKDGIIDLATQSGNGARVSWNRVNDILVETPPTEQMVMQEQRGELAGAAGNEDKIQRIAIYAMGFMVLLVFGLLFGPSIINAIFGNGTIGGLGGSLPSIGG